MSERERYAKYLCSKEWWTKRNAVMARAANVCEENGCQNAARHVHHLTYIRKYNERLEDLKALCEVCHDAIHNAKLEPERSQEVSADELDELNNKLRWQHSVERALKFGLIDVAGRLRELQYRMKVLYKGVDTEIDDDFIELIRSAKERNELEDTIRRNEPGHSGHGLRNDRE